MNNCPLPKINDVILQNSIQINLNLNRGSIRFVNDFDMTAVKRFYIIENKDTETIRGWRAHRIEQRWFCVIEGAFSMKTVRIDDWSEPSKELPVEETILRSEEQRIIHVPVG